MLIILYSDTLIRSDIEIVNSLQYFCKKVLLQYLTVWQEHCDFDQKVMKSAICKFLFPVNTTLETIKQMNFKSCWKF